MPTLHPLLNRTCVPKLPVRKSERAVIAVLTPAMPIAKRID